MHFYNSLLYCNNKTRDFWSEIRTLKVHNNVISNSIDGYNDTDDIVNVFRDTYMSLYNSIPCDEYEMSKIHHRNKYSYM